jgi:hypothetical protein
MSAQRRRHRNARPVRGRHASALAGAICPARTLVSRGFRVPGGAARPGGAVRARGPPIAGPGPWSGPVPGPFAWPRLGAITISVGVAEAIAPPVGRAPGRTTARAVVQIMLATAWIRSPLQCSPRHGVTRPIEAVQGLGRMGRVLYMGTSRRSCLHRCPETRRLDPSSRSPAVSSVTSTTSASPVRSIRRSTTPVEL